MSQNQELTPTLEDYLEVIWDLEKMNTVARVKDISERLNVTRSSVAISLRSLGDRKLLNYSPHATITLTEEGRRLGELIRHKHNLLRSFFTEVLGVEITLANSAACIMEHGLFQPIHERLRLFMQVLTSDGDMRNTLIAQMDSLLQKSSQKISREPSFLPLVTTLDTLSVGVDCVVFQIFGAYSQKRKFSEIGIRCGDSLRVESVEEENDMVVISIKSDTITLTKADCSLLLVETRA